MNVKITTNFLGMKTIASKLPTNLGAAAGLRATTALLAVLVASTMPVSVGGELRAQSSVGPTFSQTGPAAEAYGAAQNYPIPERGRGLAGLPQELLVGLHSHYDQVRPVRAVPTSDAPSPLKRAPRQITPVYAYDGRIKSIADYLSSHPATGLLIARDDTILYEHYQYARTDRDRFASWSMAKTVLGLLVGIAVSEGAIGSLDDVASKYVPELRDTEYGATPIRALLQMSSGVLFIENYQPGDDVSKLGAAVFAPDGVGGLEVLKRFNTRVAPPGTRFNYSSADSEVLGLVLRRAVGMTLTEYLSTRIWKKLGAEADAAWDVDSTGQEITFCCMVATLRDWARLGLMLANDGAWNGQQIVPRQWILDATTTTSDSYLAPGGQMATIGYGYQVWISPGERRRFSLQGIRGQVMVVDPLSRLVLVHTAVRLNAAPGPANVELAALITAVIAQYGLR
jgi:CubicO group peptidase (beta-lactamase class C family)